MDYAAWTLLQIALNMGVVFLNLGLSTAFFRQYLLAPDEASRSLIIGRTFRLNLLIAASGGSLFYLTAPWWSALLLGTGDYARSCPGCCAGYYR